MPTTSIAISKTTDNNKHWGGCGETGGTVITGVAILEEQSVPFHQQVNINVSNDPGIPPLSNYPREVKT